jgi:hypothetical protein
VIRIDSQLDTLLGGLSVNWTLHATELGSLMPGDFRLQFDGQRMTAAILLRAPSPGFPSLADKILSEIRAEVEKASQGSKHRRQLAELEQKAGELRNRLAGIDTKLSALASRRLDPSLLDVSDLAAEVSRLDTEEATLRQARAAAEKALAVLAPHQQRASDAITGEHLAEAREAIERRRQVALARRKELLAKLTAAVGPLLDELVTNEAEAAPVLTVDVALERLGLRGGKVELIGLAGPM